MKIEHMGFNLKLMKYRGYHLTDTNRYIVDKSLEIDVYIQPPKGDVTVVTFTGAEAFRECDYVLFVRAVKGHILSRSNMVAEIRKRLKTGVRSPEDLQRMINAEIERQEDYDGLIRQLRTLSNDEISEDPHLWMGIANDAIRGEEGCNHDISELEKECLFLYCRSTNAFKENKS